MFTGRIYFIIYLIIVVSYVGIVLTIPCSRVPQGSGAGRSPSTGNFRIRLSDDSGFYKPGRQYTVFVDRRSNSLRSRDGGKPKFTGFYLAVEQKNNSTSEYTEDFSPIKHGTFKVEEDHKTLAKLICGNVVTHTSDTPKSEIQVSWIAPEPGSGCVTFRATIIENRDFWYMDDGQLSKDFCEDEENQEDFISNVLEECCACHEAKYELTFEGLWSRNTHPKGFPRNVYTTKFGDIIGATHKIGNGFWANGEFASEGLKEVAELGSTRTLESELKNKSDSIRTIIKARGLSYPNITGKTFAVFRVDSENHLVSFVSTISPSPDWFVGVTALELCQSDCTWLESKVVDLYPWDAGTDKGFTYEAPDQPSRPQEYIRRITSESPSNNESPFYNQSGSKMKPLARLTLLRQRLYEKNCTAEQSASDDCQVGDYGYWGECTGAVCGRSGKQYRQRHYKNPDKATKCHRKLFETKTCIMPRCLHENEETISNDPVCESAASYGPWSPCTPNCKNSEDQMGTRTRSLIFTNRKFYKECRLRIKRPETIVEPCEISEYCVGNTQDEEVTPEQTDENTEEDQTQPTVDCNGTYDKNKWKVGECEGTCGSGTQIFTRQSSNPQCEPEIRSKKCALPDCVNKDFCSAPLDKDSCEKSENATNAIYYDSSTCSCLVFSTYCVKQDNINIFESFNECREACPKTCDRRRPEPQRKQRN